MDNSGMRGVNSAQLGAPQWQCLGPAVAHFEKLEALVAAKVREMGDVSPICMERPQLGSLQFLNEAVIKSRVT